MIAELAKFSALTVKEIGLLIIAKCNVDRLQSRATLDESIQTNVVFEELGFRLERLRRRTKGSNVAVFNTSKFRIKGPQTTMVEVGL